MDSKKNIIFFIFLMSYCFCQAQSDTTTTASVNHKIEKGFKKVNSNADSAIQFINDISLRYFKQVDKKVDKYSDRITGKTKKTLTKLCRWENKVHMMLQKVNPEAANDLFGPGKETFNSLLQKINKEEAHIGNYRKTYDAYRDSLSTGIKYLASQKDKLGSRYLQPLSAANKKMDKLEDDIANTDETEKFIRERKKQLLDEAVKYIGKSKYLVKINKETYYYTEALSNYKEIFSDPKKAEKTAKELLSKIPAFQEFMQQNGMMASLFSTPANYGTSASLAGLQTRESISAIIQDKIAIGGAGGKEAFSQNMQMAQSELSKIKDKLAKAGGGSSDDLNIPDFKPNNQRSKTFLQRLEFETNFQLTKAKNDRPAASDIGLGIGYKLNDKCTFGLGVSYKLGLGRIDRISFKSEGLGLRSFFDLRLKKQFFLSSGFEMNYNNTFSEAYKFKDIDSWQESGLIGISKKINLRSKLVKSTKLQLLYDVFYRSHIPASQPLVYRLTYGF